MRDRSARPPARPAAAAVPTIAGTFAFCAAVPTEPPTFSAVEPTKSPLRSARPRCRWPSGFNAELRDLALRDRERLAVVARLAVVGAPRGCGARPVARASPGCTACAARRALCPAARAAGTRLAARCCLRHPCPLSLCFHRPCVRYGRGVPRFSRFNRHVLACKHVVIPRRLGLRVMWRNWAGTSSACRRQWSIRGRSRS